MRLLAAPPPAPGLPLPVVALAGSNSTFLGEPLPTLLRKLPVPVGPPKPAEGALVYRRLEGDTDSGIGAASSSSEDELLLPNDRDDGVTWDPLPPPAAIDASAASCRFNSRKILSSFLRTA